MVAPHLPDAAIAPLRAISAAGLRHVITFESPITIQEENGEEEVIGWAPEREIECMLAPAGDAVIEIAEAQGARASWAIRCPLDLAEVSGAWRGLIRGGDVEDDTAWQHLVAITLDLGRFGRRLHRMLAAVDVDLAR